MNKLITLMISFMLLFTMGCDSDDTITGGAIIPEPELVGCEATTFYDWSDFEFSTSSKKIIVGSITTLLSA